MSPQVRELSCPHRRRGIRSIILDYEAGTMSAVENKQLMQHIFNELAKGNGKAFIQSLADDFRWTIPGTTKWSRTYEGKQAVRTELLDPLFAQFADQYTNVAHRFIAEGDLVVVECRGKVTTKSSVPYNNTYCWICRITEGKLRELTEYMDTQLVATVLDDPPSRKDEPVPAHAATAAGHAR